MKVAIDNRNWVETDAIEQIQMNDQGEWTLRMISGKEHKIDKVAFSIIQGQVFKDNISAGVFAG